AYEVFTRLEFRRVLFRSRTDDTVRAARYQTADLACRDHPAIELEGANRRKPGFVIRRVIAIAPAEIHDAGGAKAGGESAEHIRIDRKSVVRGKGVERSGR